MLSYLTRAEARAPGAERLALALADSGMRRFADEHHDDGGKPDVSPREGGDFEPTATSLPGGAVVDLAAVRKLVADNPGTTVVDVGRGAAVIHGAVWEPSPTLRETGPVSALIDRAKADALFCERPVIVVGTGTFGRDGYNAALRLIAGGLAHVFWFRGGEEAWAAAGLPSDDHRVP
jgi:hypothetical protein